MDNLLPLWRTSMFFLQCAALNAAWNSQAYTSREQLLMPCGMCLLSFKKPKHIKHRGETIEISSKHQMFMWISRSFASSICPVCLWTPRLAHSAMKGEVTGGRVAVFDENVAPLPVLLPCLAALGVAWNCPIPMTSRFLDLGLWPPGACDYAWKRTWKASRSIPCTRSIS